MIVRRLVGVEQAPEATGAAVVIDVLRACTTAAYALAAGADRVVLVATPEQAFRLRRPGVVLVGEVAGQPIPGFDLGNSPAGVQAMNLSGKTVVLRSSSGTQAAVRAPRSGRLLLGCLVVASATCRALQAEPEVSLLACGSVDRRDGPEDVACADFLAGLLAGASPDPTEVAVRVRQTPSGLEALDPGVAWKSPEDLECAVAVDRFSFAVEVELAGDLLAARRLDQ